MSVFIVDKEAIDSLVTAVHWEIIPGTPKAADELGALLSLENLRSVELRYPKDTFRKRPRPTGLADEQMAP